jgi:hypothetical protein
MEIPDGVSNSFTHILEIFGCRQYMDVDHGQAYYTDVLPTINTYDKRSTIPTLVKEYFLKDKDDMDRALKEILRSNSLQDTQQTTQKSGQQDITGILNKMLSLVERIESNTRPTPN